MDLEGPFVRSKGASVNWQRKIIAHYVACLSKFKEYDYN